MDKFKMVPERMLLDKEMVSAIAFHCGDGDQQYGEYLDGLLLVGSIKDDDGREVYGLHLASAECEEEGYTTLVEFANPEPKAFDEAAERAAVVKCSFCDNADAAGNPFIGGHSTNNGKLEYRVWGCKDHHDMANTALACARLKAGVTGHE